MNTYARLGEEGTVERLVDLTAEQYAAMQANGKAARLRLWVEDAKPTPGPGQAVQDTGIVIGAVEARQTWGLRAMTADEAEADALAAEMAQASTLIADIKTQLDIENPAFNAATTAGKFDILRTDRRVVLRAVRFLLRRAKRGAL
jgi:hypothetical protein